MFFQGLHRVVAILALIAFAYAQHQAWSPFDNEADAGHGRSGGSGRSYHK